MKKITLIFMAFSEKLNFWDETCKCQLISKGRFGILNSSKKRTKNSTMTCFRSFFGRIWRHQKDISKLTDL